MLLMAIVSIALSAFCLGFGFVCGVLAERSDPQ